MNQLKDISIAAIIVFASNAIAMEEGRVERVGKYLRNIGTASSLTAVASSYFPQVVEFLSPYVTEYVTPYATGLVPAVEAVAEVVVPYVPTKEALLVAGAASIVFGQGMRYLGASDRAVAEQNYQALLLENTALRGENERLIEIEGQFRESVAARSALTTRIENLLEDKNALITEKSRLQQERDGASDLLTQSKIAQQALQNHYLAQIKDRELQMGALNQRLTSLDDQLRDVVAQLSTRDAEIKGQEEIIVALLEKLNALNPINPDEDRIDREDEVSNLLESLTEEDVDSESLLTIKRLDLKPKFGLHPRFDRATYNALLQLNDLSYARANEHSRAHLPQRLPPILERIKAIQDGMSDEWTFTTLMGKTGGMNQDDDVACLIAHNVSKKLVVISFHGSQTGSPISPSAWIRFLTLGYAPVRAEGDWDANYNYYAQPAGALWMEQGPPLKLLDMDETIMVYGGHARNYHSVQGPLFEVLDGLAAQHADNDAWFIVTGHSKGASVASIATVSIAQRYSKAGRVKKVGAVVFSSPRPFCGDASRALVHEVIGRRNLFRINVTGDPVSHFPSNLAPANFRSVGVLFEDTFERIHKRAMSVYHEDISEWFNKGNWGVYHYGSNRRSSSLEFDPNLVMTYDELLEGLEHGFLKTGLTDSLLAPPQGFANNPRGDGMNNNNE